MKNIMDMYKTKDLFIASTIYALGEKLAFSEWEDGKCFLYFENKKNCENLSDKFFSGDLKVDPRVLFDAFKTIKAIIFSKKI